MNADVIAGKRAFERSGCDAALPYLSRAVETVERFPDGLFDVEPYATILAYLGICQSRRGKTRTGRKLLARALVLSPRLQLRGSKAFIALIDDTTERIRGRALGSITVTLSRKDLASSLTADTAGGLRHTGRVSARGATTSASSARGTSR